MEFSSGDRIGAPGSDAHENVENLTVRAFDSNIRASQPARVFNGGRRGQDFTAESGTGKNNRENPREGRDSSTHLFSMRHRALGRGAALVCTVAVGITERWWNSVAAFVCDLSANYDCLQKLRAHCLPQYKSTWAWQYIRPSCSGGRRRKCRRLIQHLPLPRVLTRILRCQITLIMI